MSTSWVVLKFGGTSVSSLERWETIASVVRERQAEGLKPVVVCSALSQVSNQLEALMRSAVEGQHEAPLDAVIDRHVRHGRELGVPFDVFSEDLDELRRLVTGISLTREVSPALHARVMAMGELLSTRIGEAWLRSGGLASAWVDARACLRAVEGGGRESLRFLSARIQTDADPALAARLDAMPADVLVTQGFIASDAEGRTVLLGRGGSDTSASCFAALLEAERCEIWTDVPGLYTANPRELPDARLLLRLDFAEAQEIASMGAKVLHPRSIGPVRKAQIPLHVRATTHPQMPGTVIGDEVGDDRPQLKAIASRRGITLVSMESSGMWQQVGFLASAFAVFERHDLSVDAVSTSETNVTVTLDGDANVLTESVLRALEEDLARICNVEVRTGCASVSLVGHRIRSILHQLGPALKVFEEKEIHLVTQAASDLNLTFVVPLEEVDRLVRQMHLSFFGSRGQDAVFGPSWNESFGRVQSALEEVGERTWWVDRRAELLALASEGPAWVYDTASLQQVAGELQSLGAVNRVFYSIKANSHADTLRVLEATGIGFECVSREELLWIRELFPEMPADRILFTPNFAPRHEYEAALALGVHVTLDNLHPLQAWGEIFAGRDVLLRVDPGRGRGHHAHVVTGGANSKFGVAHAQVPEFVALAQQHGARIVGLHAHSGSGIRTPETWLELATTLAEVAESLPDVQVLDIGGGLAVPERLGQPGLDMEAFAASLASFRDAHPRFKLWIEPGRFVVARAGVLLARVTQIKQKSGRTWVGLETGMNDLIRPALYGAWHPIENLTRLDEKRTDLVNIVGPICESGDTLGIGRRLPPTREGDVLLLAVAGAYGRVMSSHYNRREPAREVLLPVHDGAHPGA